MLGNAAILAILRNSLELIGFVFLFLLLNKPRFSWKKTIIAYTFFCVAYIVCSTVWIQISPESFGKYVTLSIFAGALIFFPLMSKDSPYQAIYNLSLQIFILIFQIYFAVWMAQIFFDGNPYADVIVRLFYLVIAIMIYIYHFRKPFREISDVKSRGWRPISLISIAGNLFIIYYVTRPEMIFFRNEREQWIFCCIWALLLITHLIMIRSLLLMKRETEAKQDRDISAVINRLLEQQLHMLEDAVHEAQRIRHDARHHSLNIAEYLQKGEYDALRQYISQYEDGVRRKESLQICENIAVDNILNAYATKAEQNGIAINFDVAVERNIGIKDTDFVTILANAFENAIYGSIEAKKISPEINIRIGRKKNMLWMKINNPCKDGLEIKSGIGINSIIRCAEGYGGDVDFTAENGNFVCRVLLPIPEESD